MNKIEKIIYWTTTLFIPILLFLLAPIWGSLFEEKKAIKYSIFSEKQIFDKEEFKDDWSEFKFNHAGSELTKAFFTAIKITNTGKVPIRTDDFESPIKFKVELEEGFIKTRIGNSYPKDLPVKIEADENSFSINPLLLNPGDTFFIEILTKSKIHIKKVTARIVGMGNIKEEELKPYSSLMLELVESGDTASSTTQRHLLPIPGYALIAFSLLTALCTFVFFFAYLASSSKWIKIMFFVLSMSMYALSLLSSKFVPEAYFGFASEEWMDYVSMFGLLLFGGSIAFWLRSNLGVINLRRANG